MNFELPFTLKLEILDILNKELANFFDKVLHKHFKGSILGK